MRTFPAAIILGAVLSSAPLAYADSIAVGDSVRFTGSLGTLGGGAFLVQDITNVAVPDFVTFCVQESQYINYGSAFRVGSITDYADDAGGPDVIEAETTWIMSNFSRGLLGAYSSNDIQWSIWKLEGEQSGDWGNSAALINMAHLGVLGGWTNDGVKVLNLFWGDGTPAQDQLVYLPDPPTVTSEVPEPGTVVLLGTGAVALLGYRRRRSASRK